VSDVQESDSASFGAEILSTDNDPLYRFHQWQANLRVTDYILGVTKPGKISSNHAVSLADALAAFVRMYEAHTAAEDTIVFPAWKETFSAKQFEDISDKFEEIEHSKFGTDGFEDARKRIAAIENELGLSDLNTFTAPLPPTL